MRRAIEHVAVRACRMPTLHVPQTDGTASWAATTMVIAEVGAAGVTGVGYSYIDAAAASIVDNILAGCLRGADCFAIPMLHSRMIRAVRNHGRAGVCACAISAVDVALWDLKAKLLDLPLAELLGCARSEVPVYASGGFTSTPLDDLAQEVAGYQEAGHRRVKIKIGRDPHSMFERVRVAREAAPECALMIDANGAFTRKHALAILDRLALDGIVYFEEPVSSDDLAGLRALRDAAAFDIAAGEYGYDSYYFRDMLEAGAVDILQADATRCLGITGFIAAGALADAAQVPLSAHCAPALHAHAAAAVPRLAHIEHFFDHARMEHVLFEGAPVPRNGMLAYDSRRPGLGLELRAREVQRHAA